MIMTIVESGGKLPKGVSVAVFAMLGYVVAASLAAAAGSLGSGLLVLVMGGFTLLVVDYVMWRDLSGAESGSARTSLGPYVLAGPEHEGGPEAPATIGHFDPIRREGPAPSITAAPAPVAAPASVEEPAPAPVVAPAPLVVDAAPAPAAEPVAPAVENAPVAVSPGSAEARADAVGERPSGLPAPRGGKADDLKRITGIGPGNEKKLNALGIWHLDQIAAWSEPQIRWIGAYLAFPGRIEREDWVGQARATTQRENA